MNSYFDIYGRQKCGNAFFIGANTPCGFDFSAEGEFSEDALSRLYILKGGAGTGKSTLIKKIAAEFQEDAVCYYCSSDPDSLDGVIIRRGGTKIGIIDGTAPHTKEPLYPGACGETVDLGVCFDRKLLSDKKEKIAALTATKKEHFKRAYKYLGAANEIMRARQKMSEKAYNEEKAQRWVRHFAGTKCAVAPGKCEKRRTMALSCKGAVRISGFDGAKHRILLTDCSCMLTHFTKTVANALTAAGEDIMISEAPLGGIAEIYIPGRNLLISPFAHGKIEKNVNLRRFFDGSALCDVRGKLNFTGKCLNMALFSALEELESAGKAHSGLEEIYSPAVDFAGVDKITERIAGEIRASVKLSSDKALI